MRATALALLLVGALYAPAVAACQRVTFPACLGDTPYDETGCSARYSEVMHTPRKDGEITLHLHVGISTKCRNQAFDRWSCFLFKCYGTQGLTCPPISSACWRQIN